MHADGQAGADMIGDTKLTCTVIVPTYNRAQYIGEAIRSLLAQTRKPDQIIVVNDGSTDDTLSVLDHYAGRIEIISKVNGGKATAINMAILARFCLRYLGHAESARSLGQEISQVLRFRTLVGPKTLDPASRVPLQHPAPPLLSPYGGFDFQFRWIISAFRSVV
jgi:hypothetical protein